jgi:6-pyruvoyltetrahydropterin/6-carboxytetrahydropterin synthase
MIVSYTHEIPMGHRLQHHEGKCRFLHGHNYLVEVVVGGVVSEKTGMVIDFSELKRVVRMVFEQFDHAFVLQEGDNILREVDQSDQKIIYLPFPPTAENLALYWAKGIRYALGYSALDSGVNVVVNETRDCRVSM